MIYSINEKELYDLSVSTGFSSSLLPKHCNDFVKRIGIKMISEDGTNFLQGFASTDLTLNKDHSPFFIWVHPACINTNFSEVLKENLENEYNRITYNEKGDLEKDMSKIKNKRKNQKKLEKKFKNAKISYEKPVVSNNLSDVIGKSKCNHINKENTETTEEFIARTVDNFEEKMNKPENLDIIHLTNDDDINKMINKIGDSLAELPSLMKSHVSLLVSLVKDNKDNVIAFACADTYNVAKSVGIKFINIYVNEKEQNKGLATAVVNDLEKFSSEFVKEHKDLYPEDNITFIANAVGKDKDIVAKIFEKMNFNLDGTSRGRISYSKEI